jgi:glutathione S-transferase
LQAQEESAQIEEGKVFLSSLERLAELFEKDGTTGLWREDGQLGWADVMVAPCWFLSKIHG